MKSTDRPSAALVVALTALVLALAGTATALPGKNKVDRNDLKRGAVTARALKKAAVRSKAIQSDAVTRSKIADGAVNGAKVQDGSIGAADLSATAIGAGSGTALSGLKKVAATTGASFDAARAAAPPEPLVTRGPFTLYAKCFTDTSMDQTHAYTYISTTEAGSVFSGGTDRLPGDPFLDPGTAEVDREVFFAFADNDSASGFRNQFDAAAPSGALLLGQVANYAKNGALPGGDGIYGAGDACLFGAAVSG